jgi:hypothetical protein
MSPAYESDTDFVFHSSARHLPWSESSCDDCKVTLRSEHDWPTWLLSRGGARNAEPSEDGLEILGKVNTDSTIDPYVKL